MLTTTVNFPARRAPSPQIGAGDSSLDGTTNRSAGINGASNVDAGVNGTSHLGGQRCGDHEDRIESPAEPKPNGSLSRDGDIGCRHEIV